MTRRDPLLRAARRIARQLDARGRAGGAGFSGGLAMLLDCLGAVTRLHRLHSLADGRGWSYAAGHVRGNIRREVRRAAEYAARVLACPEPSPQSTLLRRLVEDLRQPGDEFEHVEFDLKGGRVLATIKPVELEDVSLAAFAIEPHLSRLADRYDSSCFDCVALKRPGVRRLPVPRVPHDLRRLRPRRQQRRRRGRVGPVPPVPRVAGGRGAGRGGRGKTGHSTGGSA